MCIRDRHGQFLVSLCSHSAISVAFPPSRKTLLCSLAVLSPHVANIGSFSDGFAACSSEMLHCWNWNYPTSLFINSVRVCDCSYSFGDLFVCICNLTERLHCFEVLRPNSIMSNLVAKNRRPDPRPAKAGNLTWTFCYVLVICRFHYFLSLIHIWRCRRIERCRSRWSPYH